MDFLNTLCAFRKATGLFCPGCGGTRAVIAFFQGRWLQSFLYHPFVFYCFIIFFLFTLSKIIQKITKGRVSGLHYHHAFLIIGLGILFTQWILKNVLLLQCGHYLLPL